MSKKEERRKKNIKRSLVVIFCILVPFFVLLLTYNTSFVVSPITDIQQATIDFSKGKAEMPLELTENEISHLEDVSRVMKWANYIFGILLILVAAILIYYRNDKIQFEKLFRWGGRVTVIFLVFILGSAVISFDWLFTTFHKLFFPQGNWTFPADSLLIQTFPIDFFLQFSILMLAQALFIGIVMTLISLYLKKRKI